MSKQTGPPQRKKSEVDITSGEPDKVSVVLLKQGDSRAWGALVAQQSGPLAGYIRNKFFVISNWVIDDQTCQDILQQTFITAVKKIYDLNWQGEEAFFGWLRGIAENHTRNHIRHRRHNGWLIKRSLDDFETDAQQDAFLNDENLYTDGPDISILQQEDMTALDGILRELDRRDREILIKRIGHNRSFAELAEEYQMSEAALRKFVSRAIPRLRQIAFVRELLGNTRNNKTGDKP